MPTAAAIAAVAAKTRKQLTPKDIADYTNQNAGGALPTEDTDITLNMAESGIELADTYCGFGGNFNENNAQHLTVAVYGALIRFFEYCKRFEVAEKYEKKMIKLAEIIRASRRYILGDSVQIEGDADDRELGDDFTQTFGNKTGDYDG